jgi:hypothetical protein
VAENPVPDTFLYQQHQKTKLNITRFVLSLTCVVLHS